MSQYPIALLLRMTRASHLFLLYLCVGRAFLFESKGGKIQVIEHALTGANEQDVEQLASTSPKTPWVVLVDQSEEDFWGDAMPRQLRGKAKSIWLQRSAEQHSLQSPYMWYDIQGNSRNQDNKLRVLGYALGRPETISPWLDILFKLNVRIRGLYSPVLLVHAVLRELNIHLPNKNSVMNVLITPHPEGLRQTLFFGKYVRFSRLALRTDTQGESWYTAVFDEVKRLRDYLLGNGIMATDKASMTVHCVLPRTTPLSDAHQQLSHPATEHYHWIQHKQPELLNLIALGNEQPFSQLAPAIFRQYDLSLMLARSAKLLGGILLMGCLLFSAAQAYELWNQHSTIQELRLETQKAESRYQDISKTFPTSALSSKHLKELGQRWEQLAQTTTPSLEKCLKTIGQLLERNPNIIVEELQWRQSDSADTPDNLAALAPTPPVLGAKQNPPSPPPAPLASVTLKGTIRGFEADNLRGLRDVMLRLQTDAAKEKNIRLEITKMPLDLRSNASVTGSGSNQERSEITYELRVWIQ